MVNMYIEARPVSTYQSALVWNMPYQPSGTVKRPPAANQRLHSPASISSHERPTPGSLQSSLTPPPRGRSNQPVQSFKSFVKRTPSIDPEKPLPPTPLRESRSVDSLRQSYFRRSSSVYSRPSSEGSAASSPTWREKDLTGEETSNGLFLLQPLSYSTTSPGSSRKEPAPLLLEPRVFSPPIASPSPTITSMPSASPSLAREKSRSTSSRTSEAARTQKPRTVDLNEARQAMNAPGATRLLPEEMRAQASKKSQTDDRRRMESAEIMRGAFEPPGSPEIARPLLPYIENTEQSTSDNKLFSEHSVTLLATSHQQTPSTPYEHAFPVGPEPPRDMTPPSANVLPERRSSPASDSTAPRGRSLERAHSPKSYVYNGLPHSAKGDPRHAVEDYHRHLKQAHGSPPRDPRASSNDSVRTHMKMVPQPLFHGKRPSVARVTSGSSASSKQSQRSGILPLRLAVNRASTRASSTTGIIPISPPTAVPPQRPKPLPEDMRPHQQKIPQSRKDARESAYYPHVMRRKGSKKQAEQELPRINEASAPSRPLLEADIVAQRRPTPDTETSIDPPTPRPSNADEPHSPSKAPQQSLYHRWTRTLPRPRLKLPASTTSTSATTPVARQENDFSPSSPGFRLGWSPSTKKSFDEAHALPSPRQNSVGKEGGDAERSPRRPTLLGNVLGALTATPEHKAAARRREDLKRMIRVMPNEGAAASGKSVGADK